MMMGMGKSMKCLWCGEDILIKLCERPDSSGIVQCTRCGLKQLESIPDNLVGMYGDDYFKKGNEDNAPAIGYANYYNMPLHSFLWQYAFAALIMDGHKGTILDVGCADGKFVEIMEMDGYTAMGIDISCDAVRNAKMKGLHVFSGTLRQLPSSHGGYDAITAWDLLEHIEDIREFLIDCKRLLKPDGLFIFSTPDAGADIAIQKGEKWVGYTSSLEHVSFFDISFLKQALNEVFKSEPVICSFTYGEYSTILGYVRISGATARDRALESCLVSRSYPEDVAKENGQACLLSALYLHFGVDIDKVKHIDMLIQQCSPAAIRLYHQSLIRLYEGMYKESAELLQKASRIDFKNMILMHVSLEVYAQYHQTSADIARSDIFKLEGFLKDKITENERLANERHSYAETIGVLESQLQEKTREAAGKERLLVDLRNDLNSTITRLSSAEAELKARDDDITSLKQTLYNRENSLSWRFSQYYGKYFSAGSLITRIISFIIRQLIGDKSITGASGSDPPDRTPVNTIEGLIRFLDENNPRDICLIFSGTKYVENEGQRTLRLAQSFEKKGYTVIFAAWRWDYQESFYQGPVSAGIYQIPIDMLAAKANEILSYSSASQRIFVAEFPHPWLFEIISLANSYGWATIYDMLDDWESFHKVGQAVWYDRQIEEYILHNVDAVTAVSLGLLDKLGSGSGLLVSRIVPNGISPDALGKRADVKRPAEVPRGSITVGYFGHLTPAWFDWDLVISTANWNPNWKFHIIGYGKPDDIVLPDNVLFLGKVSPNKLAEYAVNWDIAMIPFKQTELSKAVDPIKIYEYLYLELPVVVTGIYHVGKYPYVWIARSPEEFEESIIHASKAKLDKIIIEKFISANTWDKRVEDLAELASSAKQVGPPKVT